MRTQVRSSARLLAALGVISGMHLFAAHTHASPLTYLYTGNPFVFCGFGCPGSGFEEENAPPNWDEDFVMASLTFADPLPANMPLTDVSSSLISWTISDAIGAIALSSAAGDQLTGWEGLGPLLLETNSSGGIASYMIATGPLEGAVGPIVILINPPLACEECGPDVFLSDFVAPNFGNEQLEWNAAAGEPGQWTAVTAIPEPASLTLTVVGAAAVAAKRYRRRRA